MDIFDGYSQNAPLLKRICDNSVSVVESTRNVLFIEYYSHMSTCNKFLLEWKQVIVYGQNKKNNTCGSNGIVDVSNMTNYNFTSPGYPQGYGKSLRCEWIFTTQPGKHLDLSFTDVDLEVPYYSPCWNDKISVYTGNDIADMKLVSTFCTLNATKNLNIPVGNYMNVTFITNDYANGTGFAAKVLNSRFFFCLGLMVVLLTVFF